MSYNNIVPWWLLDLESILHKCETCAPEERLKVYKEAAEKLRSHSEIPPMTKDYWLKRLELGIPWEVPRRMQRSLLP